VLESTEGKCSAVAETRNESGGRLKEQVESVVVLESLACVRKAVSEGEKSV